MTKDCFISDGTAETRDSKRNAAKQHSMIPACPDCPGVIYDKTVPFSVNLCLRPWTNVWVNEENYCVTVCGQSSVTSGENVRLCRFSIDTASLYLNNVFGDICPRLHEIVSVLGALGASRTLFCFVLCDPPFRCGCLKKFLHFREGMLCQKFNQS